MKKLNKSFLAIAITLGLTGVSYVSADMEISDGSSYVKMTNDGQMTVTTSSEYLKLKGKIDGYKVVLNWSPYVGEDELLGYRVEFSGPDGTENTLSVGADKTTLENWDAKAGENKYQVFAVGSEGDLKKSNEIVLKMGANGGYDFSNKSQSGSYKKEIKNEYKEKIEGNKEEMKKNLKDFREGSGYLIQYLSGYTDEQRKEILDTKKEYQDKIFEIIKSSSGSLTDQQKTKIASISEEYLTKIKELVGDNEEVLNFLKLRTEVFSENQQLRDENKDLRQDFKDKYQNTNSGALKEQRGNEGVLKNNSGLKDKYKKVFEQKLAGKLDSLSTDKIKAIIAKVETLAQTYRTNEDLSNEQKAKKVAQLEAIRDILDDKLTETEDLINIDELLQE